MNNFRAEFARRKYGERAKGNARRAMVGVDRRRRQVEPVVLDELPPVDFTNTSGNPWSGKP